MPTDIRTEKTLGKPHWYHSGYKQPLQRQFRPGWSEKEWRVLERLRLSGCQWADIADEVGRSEVACRVQWSRRGPSPEYLTIQGLLWAIEKDPTLLRRFRGLKGANRELQEVGRRIWLA